MLSYTHAPGLCNWRANVRRLPTTRTAIARVETPARSRSQQQTSTSSRYRLPNGLTFLRRCGHEGREEEEVRVPTAVRSISARTNLISHLRPSEPRDPMCFRTGWPSEDITARGHTAFPIKPAREGDAGLLLARRCEL